MWGAWGGKVTRDQVQDWQNGGRRWEHADSIIAMLSTAPPPVGGAAAAAGLSQEFSPRVIHPGLLTSGKAWTSMWPRIGPGKCSDVRSFYGRTGTSLYLLSPVPPSWSRWVVCFLFAGEGDSWSWSLNAGTKSASFLGKDIADWKEQGRRWAWGQEQELGVGEGRRGHLFRASKPTPHKVQPIAGLSRACLRLCPFGKQVVVITSS